MASNQILDQTKHIHRLSIVVLMYQEEDNVVPMLDFVHKAMQHYKHPWELIVVNDGSSDNTSKHLLREAKRYGKYLRIVNLQRNFGQTAAMQTGIDVSRGDVIATLDGDLQNDPHDIPRMVKRLLEEDLDVVSGWRRERKDRSMRRIPSRIANSLISRITRVKLNDYGCTLKLYRASVIKDVRLYGEMHRFIPAWIATRTTPARIKEEVVKHHVRQFGESKYGVSRAFRVVLDLISVYFFMQYQSKPGHFFGKIGILFATIGSLALGYLFVLKVFFGESIGSRPLLLIGVLFVLVSVQLFTTGILSELLTRTYYETSDKKSYTIHNQQDVLSVSDQDWKQAE